MLNEASGRKALIMDSDTLSKIFQDLTTLEITSMVYSRTQILSKEVFFIEIIDNIPKEKLTHLKAIFLLRGTDENIDRICKELADPTFAEYYLCKD